MTKQCSLIVVTAALLLSPSHANGQIPCHLAVMNGAATVRVGEDLTIEVTCTSPEETEGARIVGGEFTIAEVTQLAPSRLNVRLRGGRHVRLGRHRLILADVRSVLEGRAPRTLSAPLDVVVEPVQVVNTLDVTPELTLRHVGQEVSIGLRGRMIGGRSVNLAGAAAWRFSTLDASIARVSTDGRVLATGVGTTMVTATYQRPSGDLSSLLRVTVLGGRRGDLNGDAEVDDGDVNVLRTWVGVSAALAGDARDLNADGLVDGRDLDALYALCTPGCKAGLVTSHVRYLAEGATSSFFDTQIAMLNTNADATTARVRFLVAGKTPIVRDVAVPGLTRVTVDAKQVPGLESAEFSTIVESDRPLVVDRTMTWDSAGYGSHSETAVVAPSPTWYLAEGATIGAFNLFYLLQNPADTATTVRVRYLRVSGAPLEKTYTLPPQSRTSIWANVEEFPGLGQALASAEFSATIESIDGTPIIVERAMHRSNQGRLFNAGHESMGVTQPATRWFLAEGATGPFFDMFVLIANPFDSPADVRLTYLLGDGRSYSRAMVAPANARSGVWVDVEEIPGVPGYPLANVAVSTTVESTNGIPLIVERAMWWPGESATWHEAHNAPAATATGTRWAVAEGEVGGSRELETYLLIANTSSFQGTAIVTLCFEDGTSAVRTVPLLPNSRTNVAVAEHFGPPVSGRRFGAIVESVGTAAAQIVVERAMYSSVSGVRWAAGTSALAARLQ